MLAQAVQTRAAAHGIPSRAGHTRCVVRLYGWQGPAVLWALLPLGASTHSQEEDVHKAAAVPWYPCWRADGADPWAAQCNHLLVQSIGTNGWVSLNHRGP